MSFNVVLYNILKNFINKQFDKINQKLDFKKINQKILNKETLEPGTITYIDGHLMYYDITSVSPDSYNLGIINNFKIINNEAIVYTDSNTNFNKITNENFYILKRKINDQEIDIPKPYKITEIDSKNKKLILKPINLKNFDIDLSIIPDIKKEDKIYLAGVWKKILTN